MIEISIEAAIILIIATLNASVLQWRARKLRAWGINYKDAYWISVKAGLIAAASRYAIHFAIGFVGIDNIEQETQLLYSAGLLFFLLGWFFAHSSGLLHLAEKSHSLSVKDARTISANVFGYCIALAFALIFVFSIFKASFT